MQRRRAGPKAQHSFVLLFLLFAVRQIHLLRVQSVDQTGLSPTKSKPGASRHGGG